jgi:hypothetical protein
MRIRRNNYKYRLTFLSFFLRLTPFYKRTVGVEGYCRVWSHSVTRTTVGGASLDEGPARDSDNTQRLQEADIHAPSGTRTRKHSKRAAAEPRLILQGH